VRGLLVVALLVVMVPVGVIGYKGWEYTHPPKRALTQTPAEMKLSYQDVAFPSQLDHLTLRGWWIEAGQRRERLVIFTHGYRENRESARVALNMARTLHDKGIASLLFDFRGSGESDGRMTSLGYYERHDLHGAIQFAKRLGYREIGIVGFSMGAATALSVAPGVPEVKVVVADSAFSDLGGYLESSLSDFQPLQDAEFLPKLVLWTTEMLTGIRLGDVKPVTAMTRLREQGVMLIHAKGDAVVPVSESQSLYAASTSDNTHLWVSDAHQHVGTYERNPNEYLTRTTAFLEKYLVPEAKAVTATSVTTP